MKRYCVVFTFLFAALAAQAEAQTLGELNAELVQAYNAGDYSGALEIAEALVTQARRELDAEDPNLLTVVSNLGFLYNAQGRYGEAEPLYLEVLETRRRVLGTEHTDTIVSVINLGVLYEAQGRYEEAEPLYLEALETSRHVLGPEHRITLISVNNLGYLNESQGRHGVAEPLYLEALETRRRVLGPEHPDTLQSVNNLGALYNTQGRYGEAEPLYLEALETSRRVLGPEHPQTLISVNNLGALYQAQGRYGEAEPLFREALETRRRVLGPEHPDTLNSVNSLAANYSAQGRYVEAEPLYLEALKARRRVLGPNHPNTLISTNNLGFLYATQGRNEEAEQRFLEALKTSRQVLGLEHPRTTDTAMNLVAVLVRTDRFDAALARLQRLGPQLLKRTGVELGTTRKASTRRQLLDGQSKYQDATLDLARRHGSTDAVWLAAEVMLRWKGLAGEEEAYLAQLVRRTQDPRVREIGAELIARRAALATAYQADPDAVPALIAGLEDSEAALSAISAEFRQTREVLTRAPREVAHALPDDAILIEYRQYQPFDYETQEWQPPRLAAVRLSKNDSPRFEDLGPAPNESVIARVRLGEPGALVVLSDQILAPFEDEISRASDVYLAPDGVLHLIPFAALPVSEFKHWVLDETTRIRMVQSGRDIGRVRGEEPAKGGFVAFGGIDFGDAGKDAIQTAKLGRSADADTSGARETLADSLGGFINLRATLPEVASISAAYERNFPDEPVSVFTGSDARELRIKAMADAPHILHLATHGFYLPTSVPVERPMVQSGITFAGANNGREGVQDPDGEDGILYAIEALGLNLQGTELVALSACDTAQGSIDYSEGVFGLGRALRIAGADNILLTLWPLEDLRAQRFMEEFYGHWLRVGGDPADSLAAIQRAWIQESSPLYSSPEAWAPYIIIQAGL